MTKTQPKIRDINKPLHSSAAVFYGLIRLENAIEGFSINMDVDFQRDHVWTQRQQELFIGHVLEGGDVSPLILNVGPRGTFTQTCDLIDGKQRLTAGLKWSKGEIEAELYTGERISADKLDSIDRRQCAMIIGLRFATVHLTRKESLELYLRLNRGGTIHTDDEIEKVRKLLKKENTNA